MKILHSIMILVFLFSINTASAIAIPCISSPAAGIICPPESTVYPDKNSTFIDQLQDPMKFLFLVIPIALITILSFLIYFKNKNEKTLNIERIKLSLWNQLFFLIIALIGYGIYLIANSYLLNDFYNKSYSGRYTDSNYKTLKEISSFSFPIASILIAHYVTLFLRQKVHYIITAIILIIITVIGYFSLTGF